MNLLSDAIEIATRAHRNQVDKQGQPYILHPLSVMLACETDDERIVAVLHDVMEDCDPWYTEIIYIHGFPDHIIEALECLTRKEDEPYSDYIERVLTNGLATRVKYRDLNDNLYRMDSLIGSDPDLVSRLSDRYYTARAKILQHWQEMGGLTYDA